MITFYFDQHVPAAVSRGLRLRGVDVITAFEDGNAALDDESLLERAESLGRVLVTQDEDFLTIGSARQMEGREFRGIVYAHQLRIGIGRLSQTWN